MARRRLVELERTLAQSVELALEVAAAVRAAREEAKLEVAGEPEVLAAMEAEHDIAIQALNARHATVLGMLRTEPEQAYRRDFAPADRATISGLTSRSDLNGQCVVLQAWHAEAGRWSAVVQDTGEGVRIAMKNLTASSSHDSPSAVEPSSTDNDVALAHCAAAVLSRASPNTLQTRMAAKQLFSTLLVDQLLATYNLDGEGSAAFAECAALCSTAPDELMRRFGLPQTLEGQQHAAIFLQFFRQGSAQDTVDAFQTKLLRQPAAAVERTEPVRIRGFFSSEDIRTVERAAEALIQQQSHRWSMPVYATTAAAGADATAYAHDMRYGNHHVALNLHRDGHFQRECPLLWDKVVAAMRSQPTMYIDPQIALNVRCIEYHTYTPGAGLPTKGHRDTGSVVTISILLGAARSGGTFLTCDRGDPAHDAAADGKHVHHEVTPGDALIFHSMKMHNVAAVTRGVRHAFVAELWLKPTAVRDRNQ